MASLHGSFASFLKSRKDPARAAEQHVKSVEAYRALAGPGGQRELHAALDDQYRSWVSFLKEQKDTALSRVVAERVRSLNDWRDALAKAADSAAVANEWRKLAADFTDAGDRTGAVHAHEQAVRVGERLAGTSPDPEGRNAVAASYFNLGDTCLELNDVKAANAAMARARDLGEKTGYAGFQPGMSWMVLAKSAGVKLLLGDGPAALGLARRHSPAPALEEDPATLKTSGALIASAYLVLGKVLAGLGERAAARDVYGRAVTTARKFMATNEANSNGLLALAASYEELAFLERDEKDYRAAEATFSEMLTACQGGPEPAGQVAVTARLINLSGMADWKRDLLAGLRGARLHARPVEERSGAPRGVRAAHPAPHRAGRGELQHRGL